MFKNPLLSFFLIFVVAAISASIVYVVYFQNIKITNATVIAPIVNNEFQLWIIRVSIYLFLGWWQIRLALKKEIPELLLFWIAICAISFMSIYSDRDYIGKQMMFDNLMGTGYELICFLSYFIVLIFLSVVLIRGSGSVLGVLVIINMLFSVIIVFPIGAERRNKTQLRFIRFRLGNIQVSNIDFADQVTLFCYKIAFLRNSIGF